MADYRKISSPSFGASPFPGQVDKLNAAYSRREPAVRKSPKERQVAQNIINYLKNTPPSSLNERLRLAQQRLERGEHTPVPETKASMVNLGKNLPKFPVKLGALPGMTAGDAEILNKGAEDAAGITEGIWDYGTLPFYFTAAAPLAAGFDVSRGIVSKDALEVALGTIGIARPLKSIPQTMSDAAERALSYATGTAAAEMTVADFLKSLGDKKKKAE
jgi:hypothetical protein